MSKIKIGTRIKGKEILTELLKIVQAGFETVELYFIETLDGSDFLELLILVCFFYIRFTKPITGL